MVGKVVRKYVQKYYKDLKVLQKTISNFIVFVPRTVAVGVTAGGYTEILSGVEEGEMVASSGGFLIDSESQLESPAGREHVVHQK